MPKRVHSASERDDHTETNTASKRTRKDTDLVSDHARVILSLLLFFRIHVARNSTMIFDRIRTMRVDYTPNISFVYLRNGE